MEGSVTPMLEAIVRMYVSGMPIFGLLCFFALLAPGTRGGRIDAFAVLAGAVFFGVIFGLFWPLFIFWVLRLLQVEYGVFWKPDGWKSQSEIILEILRDRNEYMRPFDISQASQNRVSPGDVHIRLIKLEQGGEVTSRWETPEETEQRTAAYKETIAKRRRARLYRISDKGRRRLIEKPERSVDWLGELAHIGR